MTFYWMDEQGFKRLAEVDVESDAGPKATLVVFQPEKVNPNYDLIIKGRIQIDNTPVEKTWYLTLGQARSLSELLNDALTNYVIPEG